MTIRWELITAAFVGAFIIAMYQSHVLSSSRALLDRLDGKLGETRTTTEQWLATMQNVRNEVAASARLLDITNVLLGGILAVLILR
jgi:hypothetical protein